MTGETVPGTAGIGSENEIDTLSAVPGTGTRVKRQN
jgi:hypothetical protein